MKTVDTKHLTGMLIQFEDNYEKNIYLNAFKYQSVLEDMHRWLRNKSKYEGLYHEAFEELNRLLNEEKIDIYE